MTGSALELNLVPHDLLTEQDMIDLTGAERPDLQAKVLAANNIYFLVNARKIPRTTWYHVNNPIHLRQPTLSMHDFGYGFSKSFNPDIDSIIQGPKDADSIIQDITKYIRNVARRADQNIPPHIKAQIEAVKTQRAQMQEMAEQQRQQSNQK